MDRAEELQKAIDVARAYFGKETSAYNFLREVDGEIGPDDMQLSDRDRELILASFKAGWVRADAAFRNASTALTFWEGEFSRTGGVRGLVQVLRIC